MRGLITLVNDKEYGSIVIYQKKKKKKKKN